MFSGIVAAMPPELHFPFLDSPNNNDDGYRFFKNLASEFEGEEYPSWLAQLPETVQTYFTSRWMGAMLESSDVFGSTSEVVKALVLATGSGGVTSTVAGSVTYA